MPQPERRAFHARLEQTEPNLYRASYRGDINPDSDGPDSDAGTTLAEGPQLYPDTHIGTDAEAVRNFVETLARQHGYDTVVWEDPETEP